MKRILCLVLAVLMMATIFVGCGSEGTGEATKAPADKDTGKTVTTDDGREVTVKDADIPVKEAQEKKASVKPEDGAKLLVWAPDKAVKLVEQQCADFVAQYPDSNVTIEVKAQGEGDAATALLNDPEKAADVFGFACDQLSSLTNASVILPVSKYFVPEVVANNIPGSVEAAVYNGQLYAFPETGDNGYYLVYDKSVVSDEDAKTLEGVLEACKKANKQFICSAGDGFFACMFPFTGGLEIKGLKDNTTQLFNDYNEDEVVDTLVAFATLFHKYEGTFVSDNPTKITAGMSVDPKTVAAGIDGSWNAAGVAKSLGDNYGAVKLPTINVNGTDKQIISLHGYKLIGVNSYTKYPYASTLLADYLTSEKCQLERAEQLSWGPSNIKAAEAESVKNNVAVTAILDQAKYSLPQINIASTFWNPMGTLGTKLCQKDAKYDEATIRQLLQDTITNIKDE